MNNLAQAEPFLQSLQHLAGFLVVVLALSLLWAITAGLGKYFINRPEEQPSYNKRPSPPLAPKTSSQTDPEPTEAKAQPAVEGEVSDEEIAALTACVVAILGRRSRIVSVSTGNVDWSREGRREHFASHRIR